MDYIEIVRELNAELYERHKEVENNFMYTTNGFEHIISFSDIFLWSSEMDDREYFEETDDYEPLLPFIKKEFNRVSDKMYYLKFWRVTP